MGMETRGDNASSILNYLKRKRVITHANESEIREIDENSFAIIEPLIQMDVDTKKDEKIYSKIYHREYYRSFLSVNIQCEFCGCSIVKQEMKVHHKSNNCLRFRETYDIEGVPEKIPIVSGQ